MRCFSIDGTQFGLECLVYEARLLCVGVDAADRHGGRELRLEHIIFVIEGCLWKDMVICCKPG